MNVDWRQLTPGDIYLEPLVAMLSEANEPVSLSSLTLAAATAWFTGQLQPLVYHPVQPYHPGDFVRLPDGRTGRVGRVTRYHNPIQGEFQILTFTAVSLSRLAAGLKGAGHPVFSSPTAGSSLPEQEVEAKVRRMLKGEAGCHMRAVVCRALQADKRLVNFDDEWWLAEKLPYTLTTDDLVAVRGCLREQYRQAALQPVRPTELVQLVWAVPAVDTGQMRLATFSLNCALARHREFRYLRVGGWVLVEHLPARPVRRRPNVPRMQSTLLVDAGEEVGRKRKRQVPVPPKPSETDTVMDRGHSFLPEIKIKLLGQHYLEGFLPLEKNGLARVIPPSRNEVELAWFIYRRPDNTEDRFQVVVDYQQEIVSGGSPLRNYLASQGILPGCYLYIRRRNDIEYDIYPRLLPQPAEVECKFAMIDERGKLVIEIEKIPVPYEQDPKYVISETRLDDMEALWREAEALGMSFFDILVKKIFPELAPQGEAIHWQTLWAATFYRYRMGSQQAIRRELQRECFTPAGDGYYRFEPDGGYTFRQQGNRTSQATGQEEAAPSVASDGFAEKRAEKIGIPALPAQVAGSAGGTVPATMTVTTPDQLAVHQTIAPDKAETLPGPIMQQVTRGREMHRPAWPSDVTTGAPRFSLKHKMMIGLIIGGLIGGLAGIFLGAWIGLLVGGMVGAFIGPLFLGFIGLFGGILIGLLMGALVGLFSQAKPKT